MNTNYANMDLSSCTMTVSPPNKYHKDDTINDFMIWVRHTKLDSDAIDNIPVLLKDYDKHKQYTFIEKLNILFK